MGKNPRGNSLSCMAGYCPGSRYLANEKKIRGGTRSQLRRPHVPLKLPLLATPAYRGSFFICEGMDYKALCCRNKKISTNPVFYAIELCRLSRLFYISHILTKPKAVCDQLLSSTAHPLLCIQMLQSGDRRMVLPDGKRRFRHMICAS